VSRAPVRTVFLGTGAFAVPVLEALAALADDVRLVGVVTAPSRPAGRGGRLRSSPVALRAGELGAGPLLTPGRLRDPEAVADLAARAPDLLVLADYGQLVPAAVLSLPARGALNLHPSLLPRHRGAAPIPAAILAGDTVTGVTLMLMDEGLDTGPILAQVATPLEGTESAPVLEQRLAAEAAALLAAVLPAWLADRRAATPQPAGGATYTHPFRREDGRIDPGLPAAQLERRVRALQPWPGSWVDTAAGRLTVWDARPLSLRDLAGPAVGGADDASGTQPWSAHPGALVPDGDGLALVVADGALRLDEVQLAGGRRMTSADLRRGHRALTGTVVS
jgi:methionyl-tRNA formyltransferase